MGIKVTRSWLNNYISTTKTNAELADIMTTAGLEVDANYDLEHGFSKVVVGKIVSAYKHPDADKLSVCTIDIGVEDHLNIVCGCSTVKPGLIVAVAVIGAKLPAGFTIKKTKLRGVESQGMLCSAGELGLTELYDKSGIMHLSDDLVLGTDLTVALGLEDHIFEIEITPDRGDCLSVYGIARDIAVVAGLEIVKEGGNITKLPESKISVSIEAKDACLCYYGVQIDNINVNSEKSFYGYDFLRKISFGCVEKVVDIANFAMLDKGQPFQVFDADKIAGNILVRYSKAGEVVNLLNGNSITLNDNTLVVADDEKILAIAGVMGAEEAKVTSKTKNIFIEAAHFTPLSIAKSAREYRLASDLAYRFERGVDKSPTEQRLIELCDHILAVVGGNITASVGVISDIAESSSILLNPAKLKKLLGIDISLLNIIRLLERVGAKVLESNGTLQVAPPSWRFDLCLEVDLIEEIMRLHGYNKIPKASLSFNMHPCRITNDTKDLATEIDYYLRSIGIKEALCYSMISVQEHDIFSTSGGIMLQNPLSVNMTTMRSSLLPGLVKAMSFNKRRQKENVKFFEIGQCFAEDGSHSTNVAGIFAGKMFPENWQGVRNIDFYDIKTICEQICVMAGYQICYEKSILPGMHHGKSARIVTKDNVDIGSIGVIDPLVAKSKDLCKDTVLFEIRLPTSVSNNKHYQEHSKFPSIKRDLSLVIEDSTNFASLCDIINSLNIKILRKIKLNDLYYLEKNNNSTKSLCISLVFQHTKRTLVEEDIAKYITKIMQALADNNIHIRAS